MGGFRAVTNVMFSDTGFGFLSIYALRLDRNLAAVRERNPCHRLSHFQLRGTGLRYQSQFRWVKK